MAEQNAAIPEPSTMDDVRGKVREYMDRMAL